MKVCINLHNSNENCAHKSWDFLISFFFGSHDTARLFVTEQTSGYDSSQPSVYHYEAEEEEEKNFIDNC